MTSKDKDLQDFENAMRLDIARTFGTAPSKEEVETAKPVKAKKKEGRRVVLGISNDNGHTITEFPHESKHIMELSAEMEARTAAKKAGLKVFNVVSNIRHK